MLLQPPVLHKNLRRSLTHDTHCEDYLLNGLYKLSLSIGCLIYLLPMNNAQLLIIKEIISVRKRSVYRNIKRILLTGDMTLGSINVISMSRFWRAFSWQGSNIYLVFSVVIYRTTSLQAWIKVSVFFFIVSMLYPSGSWVTDPYGRILVFLDRSRYFFFQVAPQLYSWGWVDPVPDPLLLRKCGSAGNRTRDLWICSLELWPLDHRGVLLSST
jgi:hypothetical protein